jgi:hypothetical protein
MKKQEENGEDKWRKEKKEGKRDNGDRRDRMREDETGAICGGYRPNCLQYGLARYLLPQLGLQAGKLSWSGPTPSPQVFVCFVSSNCWSRLLLGAANSRPNHLSAN